MTQTEYVKSTENLPKELAPVWVRVSGRRPRKMYLLGKWFFYYNKVLDRNGNYCSIGDNVLWRYCKQ